VAEVTNTIVFADPGNEAARLLCADALEQLGYQSESGPWRNAYLTAALELRKGNQAESAAQVKVSNVLLEMTAPMLFDYMGIMADKQALADEDFKINFNLYDVGEQHVLHVKNGALLIYENTLREDAEATVTCPKNALIYIIINDTEGLAKLPLEGDREKLDLLASCMGQLDRTVAVASFNIIEP